MAENTILNNFNKNISDEYFMFYYEHVN
jgi:hypothetical protein